ncbi:putative helicase [Mycobacteroides abscessus subsp. abscessus]|uniref:DEAD/DEAH box helicase n=1 Tax=Mycobacteroides abscessus TaxID=36809 RepID=UPI00092BD3C2|nr:DEAD/DEAH box helicase [Mycobacteroides abscessus]SIJ20742.1 putative helicase [Mycobacteroides abscessus subsp. abscessus]SLH39546.1 putative helicase [Mycobacteroides abscessus subsp. abscessus]
MTATLSAPPGPAVSGAVAPRSHQRAALDALAAITGDRAQLRMACGTGKTLIGPWHALEVGARTVAVFTPSIALVPQTIAEWRRVFPNARVLAVCSDPSTAAGRAEIGVDGINPFMGRFSQGCDVTTRVEAVAGFLDQAETDSQPMSLVVSTHHSSQVVADGVRLSRGGRPLDLVIADEAHHLAGRTHPLFLPVLDRHGVPARRRVFTTATPIVVQGRGTVTDSIDDLSGVGAGVRSMDDTGLFGPVAYTLNVGEAIDAGLLADYRVVVTTSADDGSENSEGTGERAALAALIDVVRRYGVRRILTFHNRVDTARAFAARVSALQSVDGVPICGLSVDGSMRERDRSEILARLGDLNSSGVTVVASSQCLREGVDVPAVDAVVFADPRTSQVGIIQAIGRALRPHPGKTHGTIVIPLILDPAADDQDELATSAYTHVWRVLQGLRAHDARIGHDIDRVRIRSTGGVIDPDALGWLEVLGEQPGTVITRLLQRNSAAWERNFQLLCQEVERLGSASRITIQNNALSHWIMLQRRLFRDEMLDESRRKRLESVNGWRWDAREAADERALDQLRDVVAEVGSLDDTEAGDSIFVGYVDGLNRPLRLWVGAQLCKYWDNLLDDWIVKAFEQLKDWDWHPLSEADEAGAIAFRSFVAWEGHADVPVGHIEDDVDLDAWLGTVRRRKLYGTLPPILESILLISTPTDRNGTRRFLWKPSETRWQIAKMACQQYLGKHGTLARVPVGAVEYVEGHRFYLYQWIVSTRSRYNRGDHRPYDTEIAQFAGWTWRSPGQGGCELIEDSLAGVANHGELGYQRGCRCVVCVTDNSRYMQRIAMERRAAYRADWVPAQDVREHIQALLALENCKDRSNATFTVGAIAAAACVSRGLVSLLAGAAAEPRCNKLHRRLLLEVTADDIRAVRTVKSKRGRQGIRDHNALVENPEPTWALLDAVAAAGWTRLQIAAALGYSSPSNTPVSGEPISIAQAKLVRVWHDSLEGDLSAPPIPEPKKPRKSQRAATHATPGQGPESGTPESIKWAKALLRQGYSIPHAARNSGLPVRVVTELAADSTVKSQAS